MNQIYDRDLFIGVEYPPYIDIVILFYNFLCYRIFGNKKGNAFNNLIPSDSNLDCVEREWVPESCISGIRDKQAVHTINNYITTMVFMARCSDKNRTAIPV